MKVKITTIQRKETTHPKYGRSELVTIQIDNPDYEGMYISNFDKAGITKDWKVGAEVEIESIVSQKYTDKNGVEREAWNWKVLSRTAIMETALTLMKTILKQHDDRLKKLENLHPKKNYGMNEPMPMSEPIDPEMPDFLKPE